MSRRKTDPVVSVAGSFQATVQLLNAAVAKRGGNLAEAIVLLARPVYESKLDAIADVLATVREQSEPEQAASAIRAWRRTILEPWAVFYERRFPGAFAATGGRDGFYALEIPPVREGFTRLIVVLKGLTMNAVYAACEKQFPCWRYADDLDADIPVNSRMPVSSYAIWVRDRVEADEEFADLSANDLAPTGHKGTVLLERMLYELKFFDETGGSHLDLKNLTLCTGSRDADGDVPRAHWRGGEFRVDWATPRYRDPSLRSREVVSN